MFKQSICLGIFQSRYTTKK